MLHERVLQERPRAHQPLSTSEYFLPIPRPRQTLRQCQVHSCVLSAAEAACEAQAEDCSPLRGHLREIGKQFVSFNQIDEVDVKQTPIDPRAFWTDHVLGYKPLLMRGGAAAVTDVFAWDDAFFKER